MSSFRCSKLSVGVYGKVGVGFHYKRSATLSWKIGGPFSWDNIKASSKGNFTVEAAATAKVGLNASGAISYNMFLN